ncbi:agmatinase [Roseobacter sp. HKCCD9010]|uniref:agmatinase n=1 Tax=unclassified Roseobacter TaxID=196798 RepID=UPI0014909D72|nr:MULTISPECIES: agmatinase [unclassified Roseobacter]MBF9050320.1 agmatinase [Rhodobacterales bacterium HKCCD4356]NNV12563.1 agmatinase [Roseobacter sp. HKCCD7357]NNV15972.1 agmatinase [Roseobacter sp. HKCCD8768]NNV25432.1 agmatinase [Roseobacter sp. HKCCD8192]NNV29689.1 agmatinase [Roseobacter sp. HKCCD9061]
MALEDSKTQVDLALTREGLKGLAHENAFGGIPSFLRRRYTKDLTGVDVAITGVPFDQAVTNRSGTRLGPRAIREASSLQPFDPPYGWDGYSPLEELAVVDYGDLAFDYAQTGSFPELLQAHIERILAADVAAISLGGDHSITLPILRAHAAKHGPLALIQVDAHTDTWPEFDSKTRIDHGTFCYTAVKEGLIDVARSVHVGIRTVVEDNLGIEIIDARQVHERGPSAIAERVRAVVDDAPVYLSFDIDGLDPAFAPGTGTPVWGGLSAGQAAIFLRDLAGINLVGGDVVEVSPPYDAGGITAVAAAHVAMELLCLWGWTRR